MKIMLTAMLFTGLYIRRVAFTTLLLTCALVMAGCSSNRPDPKAYGQPPNNAYALSGGKISHFIPMPGSPSDPSDKMLLAAVGLSHLTGSAARSGCVTFDSRTGHDLVSCLVVGKDVLVVLEDFTRQAFGEETPSAEPGSPIIVQGPPYNGKPFLQTKRGQLFIDPNSPQYIQLTPNDKTALVGGKLIQLSHAVLWQDGKHPLSGDHVILVADLLRLLQERDKQMGSAPSIRNVKIIYDLRDYHR